MALADGGNAAQGKATVKQTAVERPLVTTVRDYVVLKKGDEGAWLVVNANGDLHKGSTDTQAIKAATEGLGADKRDGTFVAIPARSFRPRTRKVETVERDAWS